jgi:hypothetical protein
LTLVHAATIASDITRTGKAGIDVHLDCIKHDHFECRVEHEGCPLKLRCMSGASSHFRTLFVPTALKRSSHGSKAQHDGPSRLRLAFSSQVPRTFWASSGRIKDSAR